MMKIVRHLTIQEVDIEGEVETYCEVCGKDWGYFNRRDRWLVFRIWIHSLRIRIIWHSVQQ